MTTRSDNDYCLILAGGKGQRLWPYSRASYPKQFIDFFGTGRTQLQQTYDRMAKLVTPGHIFVSTNIDYVDLVREQLPEVARDHILAEPVQRNTAPSLAWAAYRIAREDAKANIVTVPSDQAVMDEAAFERNVHDGFAFVSAHEGFLVMGVKPTRRAGLWLYPAGRSRGGRLLHREIVYREARAAVCAGVYGQR